MEQVGAGTLNPANAVYPDHAFYGARGDGHADQPDANGLRQGAPQRRAAHVHRPVRGRHNLRRKANMGVFRTDALEHNQPAEEMPSKLLPA